MARWSPSAWGLHPSGARQYRPRPSRRGTRRIELCRAHRRRRPRAAEAAGFYGGLLPSFPQTDDPWIVAAAAARATKTFRFMVAYQPGFLHPVHAARMAASFQRLSGGRLVYNIITGGGGPEQLWWGDTTEHDLRYVRTREFLDVVHGVWNGGPFDYDGHFYSVRDGGLPVPLAGQKKPDLYFSGSSDAGIDAAASHADYYLSWLEHPEDLRTKFDHVRERASEHGREAKFRGAGASYCPSH